MAVVLPAEERNYFSTSSIRRSHSQPKFGSKTGGFHTSSSTSRLDERYHHPVTVYSDSAPSSAPSSPRTAHLEPSDFHAAAASRPKFSFGPNYDDDSEFGAGPSTGQIILPQYEGASFFHSGEDLEEPPSPKTGHSYTASPNDQDTSTSTSRPESPDLSDKAEDDTAVRAQPSRHVDYLSHNWREEDIWESWKYIVSKRGEYSNSARLENASWRTWMKAKNRLKTVSPEALNWLKDCDVTWLYGPLQTGSHNLIPNTTRLNASSAAGTGSFSNKKPILKKRSMSEIMLQRSLSASSLVKQAAAAVQAQQKEGGRRAARPGLARAATDYIAFPFSSQRMSRENTSALPSASSSGIASPGGETKHIHFNEQVEQCIAVDAKGNEEEEYPDIERLGGNSSSDEGAIMMKRTVVKKRRPVLKRSKSDTSTADSKTIAKLPSTTLKSRENEDDHTGQALRHSTGVYRSPMISPSSSQETLRPSRQSGKLFVVDDDDEEEEEEVEEADEETEERAGTALRSPTKFVSQNDISSGLHLSASSSSLTAEPTGMHRTESGMFMPFEEGQPPTTNEGLFGRVVDTVNTARDIAHVIWNVGWRK